MFHRIVAMVGIRESKRANNAMVINYNNTGEDPIAAVRAALKTPKR